MANPTYREFFDDVLRQLGANPRPASRRALAIVSIIEGVNHYWNPMNWILPNDQNFKNWNSVGVKMYPNATAGAYWTAYNLRTNSRWAKFVELLKTAPSRQPILAEMENVYASWGAHLDLQQFSAQQAVDRLNMVMQGTR